MPGTELLDRSGLMERVFVAIRDLNPQHQSYVLFYTTGEETLGNKLASARAAGYKAKGKNLEQTVQRLHERADIKNALDLIAAAKAENATMSLNDWAIRLLRMADSWIDPNTDAPKQEPLVAGGGVVMTPQLEPDPDRPGSLRPVYERHPKDHPDKDLRGRPIIDTKTLQPKVVMVPMAKEWRPDASNVRAMELLGKALGYLAQTDGGVGAGGGTTVNVFPVAGYSVQQVTDEAQMQFLAAIPAPPPRRPDADIEDAVVVDGKSAA